MRMVFRNGMYVLTRLSHSRVGPDALNGGDTSHTAARAVMCREYDLLINLEAEAEAEGVTTTMLSTATAMVAYQ